MGGALGSRLGNKNKMLQDEGQTRACSRGDDGKQQENPTTTATTNLVHLLQLLLHGEGRRTIVASDK